jgi:hypothetical protein
MTFRPQRLLLGGRFPHRRGFAGRTALLDDLDNRETMAIKLAFILIPPPSTRVECCADGRFQLAYFGEHGLDLLQHAHPVVQDGKDFHFRLFPGLGGSSDLGNEGLVSLEKTLAF